LLLLVSDTGGAVAQEQRSVQAEHAGMQNPDASIMVGDQLAVAVFDTPELSGPLRVRNDGTIDFPLVGSIPVNGLTLSSAAKAIRTRLVDGNYMKDPQITLSFLDYSNHFATVLGEVGRPGPIPLVGIRSVWEVIGAAGGATSTAGDHVTIFRNEDSLNAKVYSINWSRDLVGQPNPIVNAGDTVQVSRAGVVYVMGEVGQQGGYPITHQRLTVSQAIALAGGIKYNSKATKTQLVHRTDAKTTVTEIDVPGIIRGKVPDIVLAEDDVLYIPNSALKVAIVRGLQAAVSITSAVIIYKNQ
jgi:polysaccharide biosynthesis/export protein